MIPFKRKKITINQPQGADSTGGNSNAPVKYAIYPQPDTFKNVLTVDSVGVTRQLIENITPIFKRRNQYKSFSAKSKAHFEGPDMQQEFTAFIRVKKDSVIWVNIFGLGGMVNAARLLITPDSLFMINYLQKEVTKISLIDAARVLPAKVDFASLQRLILGEPLTNGTIKDVVELTNSWLIRVEDINYVQNLNYGKADSTLQMCQVDTHDPNGPQAILKYGSYEMVDIRKVPMLRKINIKNGADLFSLEMYFQNVDFDKELELPFNIPANYNIKN